MTAHFNNNIETLQMANDLEAMNGRLKQFAESYAAKQQQNSGIKVLVADFGGFMNKFIEYNGKRLGYDVSSNNGTYRVDALAKKASTNDFSSKIPQLYVARVPTGSRNCTGNAVSHDGTHICMETVGPRLDAVFSCLIQCTCDPDDAANSAFLKLCGKKCNDQFMSLEPVRFEDSTLR